MKTDFVVVWSGGPLLPDRSERSDPRMASMPSYDLDAPDATKTSTRKYTKTGKHVGKFSRTDPNAKQFKPSIKE